MIRFAENLNKMITAGLGGALEAPRTEVAVGHRICYLEASGPVASFETNAVAPLKKLLVDMLPVQAGSGDPSPENVRPITGRDSVTVTRAGKNLINAPDVTLTSSGYIYNGPLVLPAGKYTMSLKRSGGGTPSASFGIIDSDGNTLVSGSHVLPYTFTLATRSATARFYVSAGGTYSEIQIEAGEIASEYERYSGASVTVQLGQTVYGGNAGIISGQGQSEYASVQFTGDAINSSWASADVDRDSIGFYNNSNSWSEIGYPVPAEQGGIFDYCHTGGVYNTDDAWAARFLFTSGSFNRFEIRIPKSVLATPDVAGAKAYLNTHPLQAVYKVAPTALTLTPASLSTLVGDNNVWSDAGDVTLEYPYYEETEGY